jgi:SAM-dependent methyltransferase
VTTEENTPRVGSQEQFGRQAHFYAESMGHSSGESLQTVQEWAGRSRYKKAADIGTGTGFTAFAVAPFTENIVAVDLTPAMLRETRSIAGERGIANLGYALAAAEELPFASGSLDLLTCRIAAHHFLNMNKAIAEWYRVLAPGAVLILADTTSPENAQSAAWMNDVEERRDPSHILNLSPSEWLALLDTNGFQATDSTLTSVPLDFDDWVRRSGTPTDVVECLRHDLLNAPHAAVEAFDIHQEESGIIHFQWTCAVVRAIRRA